MSLDPVALNTDLRPAEPPPPIREGYRTMPGSRPRAGLPETRPYAWHDGEEREAQVAQLRAQTIAEAARRVPEWQPWMREYAAATNFGATFTVEQWRGRRSA